MSRPEVVWTPPDNVMEISRIGHFMTWLREARGRSFYSYPDLWKWSTDDLEGFWGAFGEWAGLRWHNRPSSVLADQSMPGTVWFPHGTLNFAEHALARAGERPLDLAVVAHSQTRASTQLTWSELADAVARCRTGLQSRGVGPGDRVCAYAPNIPETMIAFLATASLGAIWSTCAPEFGTRAVIDRFSQIEPKVFLTIDGYRYG
jgi:acetoacetyl-CoA synthetase